MKVLKTYSNGRKKVRLSFGLIVIFLPKDKYNNSQIIAEDGSDLGIAQLLYKTGRRQQWVYLLTFQEKPGEDGRIFLEEEEKSDAEREAEARAYVNFAQNHRWIFDYPDGEHVIERLYQLSQRPDELLAKMLNELARHGYTEITNKLRALKKAVTLIDNPELRFISGNFDFWLKYAVPLMKHLDINID